MMSLQVRTCRLCGNTVDGYRPYDCTWLEWNLCDGCLNGLDSLGLKELESPAKPRTLQLLPDFAGLSPFQSIGNYSNSSV
jgi:hypothetical protein